MPSFSRDARGDAAVPPKVIQTIMRHSTFKLTMDRYAHSDRDQAADTRGRMPSLSEETQRATGTDDAAVGTARSANNSAPAAPRMSSDAPIGAIAQANPSIFSCVNP